MSNSCRRALFVTALLSVLPMWPQQVHPKRGVAPAEIEAHVQKDLELDLDCMREGLRDKVLAEWLNLQRGRPPVLVVQVVGRCISGAANAPFLVYVREGGKNWRRVFTSTGSRLRVLPSASKGWRDLEFWEHGSAFESDRYVYRFKGKRYAAVQCNRVTFGHLGSGEVFKRPEYTDCERNWRQRLDERDGPSPP